MMLTRTFPLPSRWAQHPLVAIVLCLLTAVGLSGCSGDEDGAAGSDGRTFVTMGTAPQGGKFYEVGAAIAGQIDGQTLGDGATLAVTAEPTAGSQENIRRLIKGDIQVGVSNSAITYFAVRGEAGWDKAYPVRSIMTMFPNVAMFVTLENSGISSVADLEGKRVSVGPSGAGFEYFVNPILEAHGLSVDDLDAVYGGQFDSADDLGEGVLEAAFLGGGVPTASITSVASSHDIHLVEFDPQARVQLIEQYPFFGPATIPADTYPGQSRPYEGLKCGAAHLIVAADADEAFVYQLTKTIYESRDELGANVPALKSINPKNAASRNGTEFHPGAIRYYREIGIWDEDAASLGSEQGASDAAAPVTPVTP